MPREIAACGCGASDPVPGDTWYCSVEDLLKILRRRYSLAVLSAIGRREPARFQDLAARLPGASTSTLAETLDVLGRARLIHRDADAVTTGAPIYVLTSAGRKLLVRLRRLLEDVQES